MSAPLPPDPAEAAPEAAPAHRLRLLRPFGVPQGWRGVVREFAIIAAGVLAALGAQAWWEGRQEREHERAYLVQLLRDTRDNEQRLTASIVEDSAAGVATARALAALESSAPPPVPDSLVGWIMQAGRASDFKPLTGTYRALLGTGDLRLVRNDSLRARVVAYAASVDHESERLQQLRGVVLDAIGPFARAVPFIRRVFSGGHGAEGVDVERLRRDPEVATVLFTLQAANVNRLSGLRRMREETRRMRRALEAERTLKPTRQSGTSRPA